MKHMVIHCIFHKKNWEAKKKMRKKRFAPLSAVLALNDFMVCDDRDGKTMPKGTYFLGRSKK